MTLTQFEIHRCCPLCDQDKAELVLTKERLRLVRCAQCAMVYADPIERELASGQFYDRLGTPFYLSPDKLESDFSPVRFERELRIFRCCCAQGEVLDVGCSTGAFLHQLKQRYPDRYSVLGNDVTSAALDYAESRGVPVLRGSFLEHDFGARQFDAVTFWAVMEHLAQPRLFLRKAHSVLKAGGHCVILVPNMNSFAARLLGYRYRYIMPDHINYFTPATLRRLTESEPGFNLVTHGSTHFNPIVLLQDLRGGASRVPDAERARLLKRTTAYKQNPLLKPVKVLYSGMERLLGSLQLADNIYLVLQKQSG